MKGSFIMATYEMTCFDRYMLYYKEITYTKKGENMDYRLLLYFTTLIDEGSFTKAAKTLYISQPSLSTAIKQFEDDIGIVCIQRSTRKISVTKEGEILYIEAKKLLNHSDHVKKEIIRLRENGPLELQIGVIESVIFWLPKILTSYRQDHPNMHIKLHELLGVKDVERALQNYHIHLAITNQHFESKEIETVPIYKENLVAVLPNNHPLQDREDVTMEDLQHENLIISKDGFQTREDILNEFRKSGITPNIQFEIERFETACSLVKEGLGITIAPENYMKTWENPSFVMKPLKNDYLSRTVYLAFLRNRYLPPSVEHFMERIQLHFK